MYLHPWGLEHMRRLLYFVARIHIGGILILITQHCDLHKNHTQHRHKMGSHKDMTEEEGIYSRGLTSVK